ncbi:BDM_1a_G0027730.mRNA.1.CDS.1 [Saccharomyces cerevisiae]|nr:BDM_1a_G0027730.mRNA.1.CDS.1 [Saccharomyces cerevisiae]CAI7095804.1 BDM_1a_G0027730.mRNA.1.CDS.1 [Saccharomyces cerevisiae]
MNKIQQINDKELQSGILSPHQSWHNEYKDNAYIYIGNLNRELTEGDILTVFSEYGVPVDVILSRDENTGESQGFAYLKYEDQRSTILAVDNLNGFKIGGRALKIDHTFYRPKRSLQKYYEAVKEELDRDIVSNNNAEKLILAKKDQPN